MSKLVMSIPIEKYEFTEINNSLAKVRINVFHEKQNPNGSYFEEESLTNNKEGFQNKPIVTSYIKNEDGEIEDFQEHNEDESPIGVIPETNNYEVSTIDDLQWVSIDGLIFKDYCPDAYELLKQGKKISMEIDILDGFKGNDGFYHIKKFELLCITCLSDMFAPAMGENASITLFSIKDSDTFATKFSEIINKANDLAINKRKDDIRVKREEIIAKFSLLNENIEGYKEIVDNSNLNDEELEKQLFSLSQNQLKSYIREELACKKTIKKYWDGEAYESNQYYLEDVLSDDNTIVAYNTVDYKYYGIPYTVNGDKISLDYSKSKRYVYGDWRPYNEGDTEPLDVVQQFSTDIIGQAKTEIEKTKESFNAKDSSEYKSLENELNTVKADFATLQSDKASLDAEVEELRKFKLEIEQKETEATVIEVLDKYSELQDIEGYEKVVENKFNVALDELEKNLKVFAFDNNIILNKKQKFSAKPKEPTNIPTENNQTQYSCGAWDILDKYKENK